MAVTDWNLATIDGVRWLTVQGMLKINLDDVDSGVLIAVAAPLAVMPGGGIVVSGLPALVKGDAGPPTTIQEDVDFTALEYDDPTPDSFTLTQITPATAIAGPVLRAAIALHKGPPGEDGAAVLDPDDYGDPVAGQMLVVNGDADGFELAPQKVSDRAIPASITNAPSGSTSYTLAIVPVDAAPVDRRPVVSAQTTVTPSGSNCRVDVIARLNNETGGNDVGRGYGISGATERISIASGPPAGSSSGFDKIAAGADATIYIRIERQSGSDTFQTTNTRVGVTFIELP